MSEKWFEICFDGEPVENFICENEEEENALMSNPQRFVSEETIEWWKELGFRADYELSVREVTT